MHAFERPLDVPAFVHRFVTCRPFDRPIQFLEGEAFVQPAQHRSGPLVLQSHLVELVEESGLVIGGIWIEIRQRDERRRRLHFNRMIAVDDSGAKFDG